LYVQFVISIGEVVLGVNGFNHERLFQLGEFVNFFGSIEIFLIVLFFVELKIGVMVRVFSALRVEEEAGEHSNEAWVDFNNKLIKME
jgi:hypothetical protein